MGDPARPERVSKFRPVVEHGPGQVVFDKMLEVLAAKGMVGAGGKQRTDSTHVASAVRDLNRLELAGESVRACLEALAAAAPDWLASVIEVSEWSTRYGARVDSWRLPTSTTKRERLAQLYGGDALALLRAIHAETAPPWLRELPAVQVLRTMLIQNYYIHTNARGREVIRRREPQKHGLPPAHHRLSSPYDTDARWRQARGPVLVRLQAPPHENLLHRRTPPRPATTRRPRNDGAHGNDTGRRGQDRAAVRCEPDQPDPRRPNLTPKWRPPPRPCRM